MSGKVEYNESQDRSNNIEPVTKHLLHFKTDLKALHDDDDEFFHVEGLASTFGNVDLGNDIIAAGAFTETLKNRRPKFLHQHRMDESLGVIDETEETKKGLFIKARMPKDLGLAKETFSRLKIGALDSFSIGFSVDESSMRKDGVRIIEKLTLWEVSLVTLGMNEKAKVSNFKSKSEVADIKTIRDLERCLRDSGAFSKGAIDLITSRFEVKAGDPQDDEEANTTDDPEQLDDETAKGFHSLTESIKTFIKEKSNGG